jgi:hypothetical protein
VYQEASPFRKEQIDRFCAGVRKFAEPFQMESLPEVEDRRVLNYVESAASSRRFQIADGANCWLQGTPSFAPRSTDAVGDVPLRSAATRQWAMVIRGTSSG